MKIPTVLPNIEIMNEVDAEKPTAAKNIKNVKNLLIQKVDRRNSLNVLDQEFDTPISFRILQVFSD